MPLQSNLTPIRSSVEMSNPQAATESSAWPPKTTSPNEDGSMSTSSPEPVQNGPVELKKMEASDSSVPKEKDIMHLARSGDLGGMKELFDQGKFRPDYADEEGITPLHVCNIPSRQVANTKPNG